MKRRLTIAFGSLALVIAAGGLVVRFYLERTHDEFEKLQALHQIEDFRSDLVTRILEVERDMFAAHSSLETGFEQMVENVGALREVAGVCTDCHHSEEMHERLVDMQLRVDEFETTYSFYLTASGNPARMERLRAEAATTGMQLLEFTGRLSEDAARSMERTLRSSHQAVDRAGRTLVVTLTLAGLCGLLLLLMLSRSFSRPITALVEATRRIRDGALGHQIELEDTTELGELARDFNLMSRSLAESDSQRREIEKQLRHSALHDSLTDLPNRTMFLELLREAASRTGGGRRALFAVLYVDLNRFKIVNDTLGHEVGDRVIIEMAQRLSNLLRPDDTVARFGGDEFVLLLDRLEQEREALRIAGRIAGAVSERCVVGGRTVAMTASIGVVTSSIDFEQPEDLLRYADVAMYRAKETGPGQILLFDRALHERTVELMELERDLREGVDRGELECHYQPIVSLADGTIVGFEALLRWRHPEHGLLLPIDFLALAEDTGLIVPLGRWVYTTAFRQAYDWNHRFELASPIFVAANLSSKQLLDDELIKHINEATRETGVDPTTVRFELTETALLEHGEEAARRLEELNRLGFEMCLDDFGSGYSSLDYLLRLPIKNLKIDRSFLSDDHENSSTIFQTIVELGHRLGKTITVEGVETLIQFERVRQLGCEFAQGHLVSRPLTVEAAERLIARELGTHPAADSEQLLSERILRFHRPG